MGRWATKWDGDGASESRPPGAEKVLAMLKVCVCLGGGGAQQVLREFKLQIFDRA